MSSSITCSTKARSRKKMYYSISSRWIPSISASGLCTVSSMSIWLAV